MKMTNWMKLIFIFWFSVLAYGFSYCFAQIKERSIDEIVTVLKSTSAKDRLDGIKDLWQVDESTTSKELCKHYFKEEDKYLKTQIVDYAVYKKDINECVDVVLDAFNSENNAIRNSAWLGMNEELSKDERIKRKSKEVLKNEKVKSVKMNAIRKLADVDKSTETVKMISDMVLNEKDEDLKVAAVRSLGSIGTKESKREIDKYSKSKDRKISDEAKKYTKK